VVEIRGLKELHGYWMSMNCVIDEAPQYRAKKIRGVPSEIVKECREDRDGIRS
jgi:hypothetical protein